MTWLYLPSSCLPASECLAKDCEPGSNTWASRLAPSLTLSGKLTQPASWLRAWKKAAWLRHLSGATLPPSLADSFAEKWTASLLDSHAKTFLLQASAKASTDSEADSFSSSRRLPMIAVRGSCFWRTSQASLLPPPPLWTKKAPPSMSGITDRKAFRKWALKMVAYSKERPPESWENWPTSGGMRNGSMFQRPTWTQIMAGKGGSASRGAMWLTPHGMSGMEVETGKAGAGGEFAKQVTHWSTPKAPDGTKGGPNQAGSKGDLMLPSMVAQWPTPAARDYKSEAGGGKDSGTLQPTERAKPGSVHRAFGLFAPGPADARWRDILDEFPEVAPALEPAFRRVVNGLAFDMGDSRAARLKCVGNGVVALSASAAFVVLARRAGIFR